jgi:hypothetical protein
MNKNQVLTGLILLTLTDLVRRAICKTSSPELSRVINGDDVELSAETLAANAIRANVQEK